MSNPDQGSLEPREGLQAIVEHLAKAEEVVKAAGINQETVLDPVVESKIRQLLCAFVFVFRQVTQYAANETATYIQQKLDLEDEQRQDYRQLPSFAAKFDEAENEDVIEKCKDLRESFQFVLSILFELQELGQKFQSLISRLPPGRDELDPVVSDMSELSAHQRNLLEKHSIFILLQPPAVVRTPLVFETRIWYFLPNYLLARDEKPEVTCVLCNEGTGRELFDAYRSGLIRCSEDVQSCASIEMFADDPAGTPSSAAANSTAVRSIVLERDESCFSAAVFLKIPTIEDKLRNCANTVQLKSHIDESAAIQIERIGTAPALRRYCFSYYVTHTAAFTKNVGTYYEDRHVSLAISLPFCIAAHSSQHCIASAIAFWTRAFGDIIEMDRFDSPACVDFDVMVVALEKLFRSLVRKSKTRENTRHLDKREMDHISDQLHSLVHGNDDDRSVVYWAWFTRFTRKENENKKMSFWLWFYKTAELILYDQYVNDFWNKEYILGFYQKEEREALLKETGDDGSFGLFFSDGSPGAIIISVLLRKKQGKIVKFEVSHVEPFDLRRLKVHGLLQYIEANTPHLTACPKRCDEELRELIRQSKRRDENNMLPGGYKQAKLFTDDHIKYDGVIVITAPEYKGGVFERDPSPEGARSSASVEMVETPESVLKAEYYQRDQHPQLPSFWTAPDVWSFGVLLFEIFTFGESFADDSPKGDQLPRPSGAFDTVASQILQRMALTALKYSRKWSLKEVLAHVFFRTASKDGGMKSAAKDVDSGGKVDGRSRTNIIGYVGSRISFLLILALAANYCVTPAVENPYQLNDAWTTITTAVWRVDAERVICRDQFERFYTFTRDVVVDVGGIDNGQPVGHYRDFDMQVLFSTGAKLRVRSFANGGHEVAAAEPADVDVFLAEAPYYGY